MAAERPQAEGWLTRVGNYDLSGPFGWVGTIFKQLPLPALFMSLLALTVGYRVMPADELRLEVLSAWGDFESRFQLAVLRENNAQAGDGEPTLQSYAFYYLHRWAHRGCAMRYVRYVLTNNSRSVAVYARTQQSAALYSSLDSDESLAEAFALSDLLVRSGEPDALELKAAMLASSNFMYRLRSRGVFADTYSHLAPDEAADVQLRRRRSEMIEGASLAILATSKTGKNAETELERLGINLDQKDLLLARRMAANFKPEAKSTPWRNSESNAGWDKLWTFTWQGFVIVSLSTIWALLIASQLRAIEAVGLPLWRPLRQVVVYGAAPMIYLVVFMVLHERDLPASFLMPAHPVAHVIPFLLYGVVTWSWVQVIDDDPYDLTKV